MHAPRKLAERDQMPVEIANLIFVRLAHVQNEQVIAAIEPGFQFARSNLRDLHGRTGGFFAANAAELEVVDELGDGWIRAAHRAVRALPQLQLTEFHSQRIEEQQAPDE